MSDADVAKDPLENRPQADLEAAAAPPPPDESPSANAELEQAREQLLRTQAELENFRKRARRELEQERRYALLPLISELLPVLDNLARAVEAAEQSDDATGLLEGVKMVSSQLQAALEKHHCRPIEAAGAPFDPNLHEAIGEEPSDEQPSGTVTRVTRVGYQLHDRVVRPSQVLISAGAAAANQPAHPSPAAGDNETLD